MPNDHQRALQTFDRSQLTNTLAVDNETPMAESKIEYNDSI